MPKKHKTRKQREKSQSSPLQKTQAAQSQAPAISYTVPASHESLSSSIARSRKIHIAQFEKADAAYLRRDMISIAIASGIIVGFNLILFTLLSTGTIKLNFLGY